MHFNSFFQKDVLHIVISCAILPERNMVEHIKTISIKYFTHILRRQLLYGPGIAANLLNHAVDAVVDVDAIKIRGGKIGTLCPKTKLTMYHFIYLP